MESLGLPMADYEDAILTACADRGGAEYVATGDASFIETGMNKGFSADVMRPSDILALLNEM